MSAAIATPPVAEDDDLNDPAIRFRPRFDLESRIARAAALAEVLLTFREDTNRPTDKGRPHLNNVAYLDAMLWEEVMAVRYAFHHQPRHWALEELAKLRGGKAS